MSLGGQMQTTLNFYSISGALGILIQQTLGFSQQRRS